MGSDFYWRVESGDGIIRGTEEDFYWDQIFIGELEWGWDYWDAIFVGEW